VEQATEAEAQADEAEGDEILVPVPAAPEERGENEKHREREGDDADEKHLARAVRPPRRKVSRWSSRLRHFAFCIFRFSFFIRADGLSQE
jgi:hypothetical protein